MTTIRVKNGFSLIELMISVIILAIILTICLFVNKSTTFRQMTASQVNIQTAGKSAIHLLTKEIRGAKNFGKAEPDPTDPKTVASIAFYTTDNRAIRYYLDEPTHQLRKQVFSVSNQNVAVSTYLGNSPLEEITIASDVQSVSFGLNGREVNIEIVFRPLFARSIENQRTFPTQVYVRNPL